MPQEDMKRIVIYLLMLLATIAFVLPVVLIFVTAFKPEMEVVHFERLLPKHWTTAQFAHLFSNPEEAPIFRWLFNSFLVSTCITLLVLTVDSLAAYGLSRLNLPGGKVLFAIIIGTLMVPGQVLFVPVYLILNRLGWLDTPLALIVPAGAGAFGVFLLTQFFRTIPKELEEAAQLDGCSRFGVYRHIMLPLSMPALATLGILTFTASWNDFLGPLVFLDSSEKLTLPVGVALFQGSYVSEYALTLAASVICTAPVLLIFFIFSKQIIRGISTAGLKE
ncbi:MAG: carbohydrate ABC transporter permease [Anaerolineae bacterium]|nr:carbohydrate ABC transporter permease [Phycisphaerae bacterium]